MSLTLSAEDLSFDITTIGPLKFFVGNKEGVPVVTATVLDLLFFAWISVRDPGRSWGRELHMVFSGEEIAMYTHQGLVAKQS